MKPSLRTDIAPASAPASSDRTRSLLRPPRTLWFRLFVLFALIVLLLTAGYTLAFRSFWVDANARVRANRYSGLASDLAQEIQPNLDPVFDERLVRAKVQEALRFNPDVDVYLVRPTGDVETKLDGNSSIVRAQHIGMEAVEAALGAAPPHRKYLFGTDPSANNQSHRSPFSAALVRVMGEPRILYAVLENQRSRSVTQLAMEGSIIQGGGIVMLSLILGTLLLSAILVRLTMRRFSSLVHTVQRMRDGELRLRAPSERGDELSVLGSAINEMADTIAANIEALRSKDATRRELIGNIWHDIKGPVAGISALAQTLAGSAEQLSTAGRESAQAIQQNVKILAAFLNDLRELSALEARDATPVFAETSCSLLADEIEIAFAHRARAANIGFRVEVPEDLPFVRADAMMLQRALMNLLENAVRHTSSGGTVILRGVPHNDGVRMSVEDSGVGISTEELSKIFERNYQGQDGSTPRGSAGLGLAIVQRIIEHHGSAVSVSSELGKGTAFSFDLPPWKVE